MGSFINDKGYYCYVRPGYQMSGNHGYHAAEHKEDMTAIANEVSQEKIDVALQGLEKALPQMIEEYGRQVWERLISSMVGALETDVNSEVRIALDGAADIFYGKAAQKYISDNIMNTLKKELDKIRYINF